MARTYLERHLDEFVGCGRDALIEHGLKALKESLSQDKELTIDNTTVGIVGVGNQATRGKIETFKLYDGQEVAPFLEAAGEGVGTATEETGPESMEIDS